MLNADAAAHSRTLTLVLSENDWRALRDAEPDAVAWLQQQIRNRLATPQVPLARPSVYAFYDDEY